jgi:hypothetical protein
MACALPLPPAELADLRATLQDFARKLRTAED